MEVYSSLYPDRPKMEAARVIERALERSEYCDGVDMTIGMIIGIAAIFSAILGAAGMFQGMLRRCCPGVIAAAFVLLLDAKQGQDVYLIKQLLPSFLSYTCPDINHACYKYVYRLL